MTDMFAKLSEMLQKAEFIKAQEQEAEPLEKRKKQTRRKKKKAKDGASSPDGRSPSPSQQRHRSATYPAALPSFQSPSALKSNYPRPHSALLMPTFIASSPAAGRPHSAAPHAMPLGPAGPSARAVTEAHWRNVSPPKYTATSLKQPELGTVPGKYQSAPWSPAPCNDRDPSRQEIDQPIKEARFKHVLAVPAHVLAQSLYHPNCPSDRARAKQLSEDLKVARMDRRLVIVERTRMEVELRAAQDTIKSMEETIKQLHGENSALQEQVTGLLRSHKALTFERNQLEEQVKVYSSSGSHSRGSRGTVNSS